MSVATVLDTHTVPSAATRETVGAEAVAPCVTTSIGSPGAGRSHGQSFNVPVAAALTAVSVALMPLASGTPPTPEALIARTSPAASRCPSVRESYRRVGAIRGDAGALRSVGRHDVDDHIGRGRRDHTNLAVHDADVHEVADELPPPVRHRRGHGGRPVAREGDEVTPGGR